MKQSVTVGAQLLWGGRYGCNNGRYGCTIVMSYIEINKAVSQWLLTFNLCVSVTWPLTCAFHIPCTHTPEIIDMHRGVYDNRNETSTMATRHPFGKWHRSKSIAFYPYTQVLHYWSLLLLFKAKLKLESRKHKKTIWPPGDYFESEVPENQPQPQTTCTWNWNWNSKVNSSYAPETIPPTESRNKK